MPIPFLPIIVISLVGTAYHQSNKKDKETSKGVLTPERQHLFETAINDVQDPAKLRKLAKVYRDAGLPGPASLLEKRAALRELPEDIKVSRRATFRKAMSSTNPQAVNYLANVFEGQGAMGAAAALRKYAASIPPVDPNVTAPQPAEPVTPAPAPIPVAPSSVPTTAETADTAAPPPNPSTPEVHPVVDAVHGESESV